MEETIQQQLSGYGVKVPQVSATLAAMELQEPYDKLEGWDDAFLRKFVKRFVAVPISPFPHLIRCYSLGESLGAIPDGAGAEQDRPQGL